MKKDYKYGTLEYRLEEAKESIDRALELSSKLRAETGSIKPVEKIDKIGKLYASISDYYRPTWPTFDLKKEDHVKQAATNARTKLEEAKKEVERIHENNLEALDSNRQLTASIINFMGLVGIPQSYSTWSYKTSKSARKTETVHCAGYIGDIARNVIIDDGYSAELVKAKSYGERIDKYEKESLVKIAEIQKAKEKEDSYLRKVAKALTLAEKYGIKPEDYSDNETLFLLVNDKAEEDWRKENFPNGKEVDISCCSECSSWTVGEHRCSCGNRRMYLDIDGDFFGGFYGFPQAD